MKPKEQTKPIEGKFNNQSRPTVIFNDLSNRRKKIMSELHDSVDYNILIFEYIGPTKDESFYEYKDSKELLNAIKNDQIKFSEVKNKQDNFLKKLNEAKIGKTTTEQEVINNINNFYKSREEVNNFFRDYIEILSDANYNAKQDETKGLGLKILSPKQILQRLPIALVQVKADNNSESLLMKSDKLFILCINQNKSQEKYTAT